jgi:hypothetical protein
VQDRGYFIFLKTKQALIPTWDSWNRSLAPLSQALGVRAKFCKSNC